MSGQTGSQASPCPDPEVVRGFGSEALNRPLQTYYLLFTRPYAEQMGAVSGVAPQPAMGSGVGQAKNCTRVRDQLRYLARIRGRSPCRAAVRRRILHPSARRMGA